MQHSQATQSRSTLWWAASGLLLLMLPGPPEPQAMAGQPGDPAVFIQQLNAGALTVRDAAVDGLLALGPQALPAIEQAIPVATGEAAFRLPLIAEAIARTASNRMLELKPEQSPEPATAAGPFSLAVQRVDRLGDSGYRLLVRLRWQPPLEPVLLRLPLVSLVAEGPAGDAVPIPGRQGTLEPLLIAGRHWVDLPIRLGPPPPSVGKLNSLRGTIECWVPGFEHRFMVPLQTAHRGLPPATSQPGPVRSLAGLSVQCRGWSIETSEPTAATCRVELSARFPEPSEALASHRNWLADRQPQIVLPTGRVITATDHRVLSRNNQGLTIAASFALTANQLPRGTLVTWRLPLGVRQVPVDFWLQSVSLSELVDEEN